MDAQIIDEIVLNHKESGLIGVLQKTQKALGYLSKETIRHIAEGMNLPAAKVYGVATFYTQFRLAPIGKHSVFICKGTACHVNGAVALGKAVLGHLGISDGETTEDGLFTLSSAQCLGCCSLAPVMMVDDKVYGLLSPQKAIEILDELKGDST